MILIDAAAIPKNKKLWYHMASDTSLEELHWAANRLGLRRSWFQPHPTHPHYDITEGKRIKAIDLWLRGRIELELVSSIELVKRCAKE